MALLCGLLLLTGLYPLAQAWRANRRTTLRHPLGWAFLAWLVWIGVAWIHVLRPEGDDHLGRYLALCLTGCSGIAVLGARRPGAAAWNFVVVGLLAVLLLPVLKGLGETHLEAAHWLFLGGTLAAPIGNYLPTRLGAAAVLLAVGCGCQMAALMGETPPAVQAAGMAGMSICPWAALAFLRGGDFGTEFDRLWRGYRDRFGFVWGQRMREQFNRAAVHAGWRVELRWDGLHPMAPEAPGESEALLATLRAVAKRFTLDDEQHAGGPGDS